MTKNEQASKKNELVSSRQILASSARIFRMMWQEHKTLFTVLAIVFLAFSATPFLRSGALAILINELVRVSAGGVPSEQVVALIVIFLAASVVPAGLYIVQNYFSKMLWFVLDEKFNVLITKRRGELDVALHEDPKHNDLFNKITENGIWRLQNFVDRQYYVLQNFLEVIIASFILWYASWWIYILIVLGTIPELIVEMRYGEEVWGLMGSRAETRRKYWALQRHFTWLPNLIELKLFQNIGHFTTLIKDLYRSFQDEQKKLEVRKLSLQLLSLLVSQSVIVFAATWFIFEVIRGAVQIGTLTFLLASIAELRQSLSSLFYNVGRQYQDGLFVSDVFRLVDMQPYLHYAEQGIVLPPDATPVIVFENVTFRYPGSEQPVLKNISLTIRSGEKIALVGVNGAGKTTLIKLLCRFYDPTEGRITLNGHDLRDIDLQSWYSLLGALFQEYAQYNFVVREAIAVGRTQVPISLPRAQAAAVAGEADVFIEAWPGKYEQMLGKQFRGGLEPSIGQWQKLALARAFYRDPRIYILDEPTSSIDAEAEARIFDKLESLPKDRTVILISHRFSTVRHANQIIVLEDGSISEQGTHEALVANKKTYARLFTLQAKGYR